MGRTNSEDRARQHGVLLKVRKVDNRSMPVVGRRTKTADVTYKCLGCNYRVPYPDSYCGECLCEEDDL